MHVVYMGMKFWRAEMRDRVRETEETETNSIKAVWDIFAKHVGVSLSQITIPQAMPIC